MSPNTRVIDSEAPRSLQVFILTSFLLTTDSPEETTPADAPPESGQHVSMWTAAVIDSWEDVFSWWLQGLRKVVILPIMLGQFMNLLIFFFFSGGGDISKCPQRCINAAKPRLMRGEMADGCWRQRRLKTLGEISAQSLVEFHPCDGSGSWNWIQGQDLWFLTP